MDFFDSEASIPLKLDTFLGGGFKSLCFEPRSSKKAERSIGMRQWQPNGFGTGDRLLVGRMFYYSTTDCSYTPQVSQCL